MMMQISRPWHIAGLLDTPCQRHSELYDQREGLRCWYQQFWNRIITVQVCKTKYTFITNTGAFVNPPPSPKKRTTKNMFSFLINEFTDYWEVHSFDNIFKKIYSTSIILNKDFSLTFYTYVDISACFWV